MNFGEDIWGSWVPKFWDLVVAGKISNGQVCRVSQIFLNVHFSINVIFIIVENIYSNIMCIFIMESKIEKY